MKSAVTNLVGALIWGMILFCAGYGVGKHNVQKPEVADGGGGVLPLPEDAKVADDVKEISGAVWYSERNKAWRFMHTEGFDKAPHDLANTELLGKLIASHQKLQDTIDRKTYGDCSYGVGLQVRRLEAKRETAPGDSAAYEVLKVHYVETDFCYHCEHAIKAKRE